MTNGVAAPPVTDIRELQQKLQTRITEARNFAAPYAGKGMPADAETQFKAMIGDIDGIKASIKAFQQLGNLDRELNEPTSEPVSWRPAVGSEGDDLPVDGKAWRTYEVKNFFGQTREVRYNVPLAVSENVKKFKGADGKTLTSKQYERAYADGHELYMRKGAQYVKDNYPIEWKSLSEGVDTAGGFTVPVDFHAQLIKKIAAAATVRPNATVMQTSRDVVIFPRVNYSSNPSDDSSSKIFTSGVRMTWTGELPATSTTARVTDQVFGQQEIKVNTAIASQLLSNDLIEDAAFDIAGYASDNLAEAFALGENYAFLQGSGVAQPTGLMSTAGNTNLNGISYKASGTSADISTSSDAWSGKRVLDVFYNLPAQYRRNAMWLMTSLTQEAVENLVDGNKRPVITSLIGGASLAIGMPDVIKQRPLVADELMPEIAASSFPIVFGDFRGYYIVDRVQFSVQRYTELYVETNFTLLLARKRVGGLCCEPWKFMAMKAATS